MAVSGTDPVALTENQLLNLIYLRPYIVEECPEYNENIWVHDIARCLAKAICTLYNEDAVVNCMTVYNEASKYDPSVHLDTVKYFINLNKEESDDIGRYVRYLKDYKRITSSLENMENIRKVLASCSVLEDKHREVLRKELREMEEKLLRDDSSVKDVMNLKEWGDKWEEEFKERRHGKKYFFNEPVLDKLVVDGPLPGTIGLLVAASGMGKSATCLKIVNGFINAEIPCMFFSLEMGAVSTYDRLLASRMQIPYSEIVNPSDEGTFDSIYAQVKEERKRLDENKLFRFCEDASLTLDEIDKEIMKFQEQIGQKFVVVVVDLLSMVKDFLRSSNGVSLPMAAEIGINKASEICKKNSVFMLGTCQINRSVEQGNVSDPEDVLKFRPTSTAIRGSDSYLQRARFTVSVFRKKFYLEKYFPDDEELLQNEPDIIELSILKQNNGNLLRMREMFYPETFTMLPLMDEKDGEEKKSFEEEMEELAIDG